MAHSAKQLARLYLVHVRSPEVTYLNRTRKVFADLPSEKLGARTKPLLATIDQKYWALRRQAMETVEAARAKYIENLPAAHFARAAFKNPERAAAIRSLATGASDEQLDELIKLAVSQKDLAAAHGLRGTIGQSLQAVGDGNPGTTKRYAAMVNALDGIVTEQTKASLAELVAAQHVALMMEAGGPEGSSYFMDPVKLLAVSRESSIVPTDTTGGTRSYREEEVDELLALADVSRVPPQPVTEAETGGSNSTFSDSVLGCLNNVTPTGYTILPAA